MTQGSEAQDVFRLFLENLSQLWLHTRSRCLLVFDEKGTVISTWGSLPAGSVQETAEALARVHRDWEPVQALVAGHEPETPPHLMAWGRSGSVLMTPLGEGVLLALVLDAQSNIGWARLQVERAHRELAEYMSRLMKGA